MLGDGPTWRYLSTISRMDPDLCERVLRASGHRSVGDRIPGALILRDAGWDMHDAFELVTDLQGWSIVVFRASHFHTPYWWLRHLEGRVARGTARWNAQGCTGPCPCLMCRVRRMWIQDMEDALSEW